MEVPKILILSKDKPAEHETTQFVDLLRAKSGDVESQDMMWKIKTKYYEAKIEIC